MVFKPRTLYLAVQGLIAAQKNEATWHCKHSSGHVSILKSIFCPLSCFHYFLTWYLQEDDYIPHVKDMIALQRRFEKPHAAANAIFRQANKPAGKSKAKAKAKK